MAMEEHNQGGTNLKKPKSPFNPCKGLGIRHVIVVLGFFGIFNNYSMRQCLSVAIVAMVNSSYIIVAGNNTDNISFSSENSCPDRGRFSNANNETVSSGTLNWNLKQQGILLGAYFYGYACSNIIGGYVVKRYGIRLVMGLQMLISSVVTLVSPTVALAGYEIFVVIRIILGLLQGMSYPSMICCWKVWATPYEQSFFTTIHTSGGLFGLLTIFPVGGALGQYLGWEAIFYFVGSVTFLWSIIWLTFVRDCPSVHPFTSEKEKNFLLQSRQSSQKTLNVSIFKVIFSLPVWGIVASHFASNYGLNMLDSLLPTYMTTVQNFNLLKSGALSMIPYILHCILMILSGWLTDHMKKSGRFRIIIVRKINVVVGLVPTAVFLVLAGYVGCNVPAAVAMFSLAVALCALVIPGSVGNVFDIAPDCPEIVFGLSNSVAATSGFVAPTIVGVLINNNPSISQWQTAFFIAGAVFMMGALIFVIVGTDKPQKWGHSVVTNNNVIANDTAI